MQRLVLSCRSLDLVKHGLLYGLEIALLHSKLCRKVSLHVLETCFKLFDARLALPKLRVLLDLLLLLVRDVLLEHLLEREYLLLHVFGLDRGRGMALDD